MLLAELEEIHPIPSPNHPKVYSHKLLPCDWSLTSYCGASLGNRMTNPWQLPVFTVTIYGIDSHLMVGDKWGVLGDDAACPSEWMAPKVVAVHIRSSTYGYPMIPQ